MLHYRLLYNVNTDEWQLFYRGRQLSNAECNRIYHVATRRLLDDNTVYHNKFCAQSLVSLLLRVAGNVPNNHLKLIEFDINFHIAFVYSR